MASSTRCWWLAVLLFSLHTASSASVPVTNLWDELQNTVAEVVQAHCPSKQQEANQEKRIIEGTTKALKSLFAETFSGSGGRPNLDPLWRCSCPSGYIPCGGRCYARLHRPVEYAQAERECSLLGAHLAVPRSRQQSLCVAGLAGHEDVWLGITDRDEEGFFQGADGRPVTDNEGQVWSPTQPDNAGGVEHCVSSWKVKDGVRFGEWNDYPCTGIRLYPMCQLP
ncbi:perlucin-like [Amphibalanus amphitrite]|uniref:perlucin-like n=1 Tax=Amphibalanus amphitrite TaxID=1232801 RepID=UPI001C922573|nr:perlucin-like [Amphibalanus amphitrite]